MWLLKAIPYGNFRILFVRGKLCREGGSDVRVHIRKCISPLAIAGLYFLAGSSVIGAEDPRPPAHVDRQTRKLVVASSNNFPPINFLDGKGDLTGFAREISMAVADAVAADTVYIHSSLYQEKYPEIRLHHMDTPTEAFYLLVHGGVDAFVYPKQVVMNMAQELRIGDKIKNVGNRLRTLLARYSQQEVELIAASAVTISLLFGIAVRLLVLNVKLRKTKVKLSETLSELKNAETVVSKAFHEMEAIVAVIPDFFFMIDLDANLVKWNKTVEIATGLAPETLRNRSALELIVEEDRPSFIASIRKCIEEGEAQSEIRVQNARGDSTLYQLSGITLKDEGGNIVGITGTGCDITERKRAEDALRESESRYRTIFDHGADGIVIIDPDTATPVDFNNQACAQLGYTQEEFCRLKISDIDLLEGTEEVRSHIQKVLDTGYDEFETLHRTKHGEQRNIHVKAQYIVDAGKAVYHCIWRDITDSRRSEETARMETSLRNILLDNLPCAALVLKKQTREIVACNELAKKYGAVVGRICHDVIAVPGTPCPFCQAPEVWETGASKQVEVEYMGRFWQGIWVPFSDDLYVHYIFEITDRKRAEAEREKLQKQLQVAQRMEAVGTLAGGIAHDFNNALMGIFGFTEALKGKLSGDERALSDLYEIMRSAERASMLTRQLLTYARRQIIDPVNLSLNKVVTDLMKLVSKLVGEQIEIQMSLAKDLPAIRADVGQIEQVVMNLVLNARDAMPSGGKLAIETGLAQIDAEYCRRHPYAKAGTHVVLAISDTGIGMDKTIEERAFEPFFTTKEPDKGTGLGLSMVYGIVKQHDGFINLYSEPGIGTSFKIYLPAVEGSAAAVVSSKPSEIPGGTETILLAEDDESVRRLVERTLTDLGYTVLVTRDGEDAVEAFRKNGERINLALLDVVMPRKGGKDAYGEMQKVKQDLKVVFMSGYTSDAIHESFELNPGIPFLSKPFSRGALARKVREVLDKA